MKNYKVSISRILFIAGGFQNKTPAINEEPLYSVMQAIKCRGVTHAHSWVELKCKTLKVSQGVMSNTIIESPSFVLCGINPQKQQLWGLGLFIAGICTSCDYVLDECSILHLLRGLASDCEKTSCL